MAATARPTLVTEVDEPVSRSSVADEMEAIFVALPRTAPSSETKRPVRRAPARRHGLARWGMALIAVTALLALATMMITMQPAQPVASPVNRVRDAAVPLPAPRAAKPPSDAPAATPATAPAAPLPQPPRAAPRARLAAVQVTPRREAHGSPGHATEVRRTRPPQRAKAGVKVRTRGCRPGASSAWCLRDAVMAADRRLREAYDDAIAAGVPRSVLVGVRSDWKHLRGRANQDPEALIRGYSLLTQDLRAEAQRGPNP